MRNRKPCRCGAAMLAWIGGRWNVRYKGGMIHGDTECKRPRRDVCAFAMSHPNQKEGR